MRRLLFAIVVAAALSVPAAAAAHPLGNFTVNRFADVELAGDRLYVRYVLDLAEIPTFQERKRVARGGFARSLARGLDLRLDGRRVTLGVVDSRATFREGQGGLETLRFEAVYRAPLIGARLEVRDRNYEARRGWRELVVTARNGAELHSSTRPVGELERRAPRLRRRRCSTSGAPPRASRRETRRERPRASAVA